MDEIEQGHKNWTPKFGHQLFDNAQGSNDRPSSACASSSAKSDAETVLGSREIKYLQGLNVLSA